MLKKLPIVIAKPRHIARLVVQDSRPIAMEGPLTPLPRQRRPHTSHVAKIYCKYCLHPHYFQGNIFCEAWSHGACEAMVIGGGRPTGSPSTIARA